MFGVWRLFWAWSSDRRAIIGMASTPCLTDMTRLPSSAHSSAVCDLSGDAGKMLYSPSFPFRSIVQHFDLARYA